MKKILTLLLLATLLLTACANENPPLAGDTDGETTLAPTDAETTTPEDEETTTPEESETQPPIYDELFLEALVKQYGYESYDEFMYKRSGKSLYPVIGSVHDVYIGMSKDDFLKKIIFPIDFTIPIDGGTNESGNTSWMYFWVDKDGHQVLTLIDDGSVCEIKVFKDLKDDVTKDEILLIKPGTHVYDVISLAGFPRYLSYADNPHYCFGSQKHRLMLSRKTLTLIDNRTLKYHEFQNSQESTESTDLENSITEPTSIN